MAAAREDRRRRRCSSSRRLRSNRRKRKEKEGEVREVTGEGGRSRDRSRGMVSGGMVSGVYRG